MNCAEFWAHEIGKTIQTAHSRLVSSTKDESK